MAKLPESGHSAAGNVVIKASFGEIGLILDVAVGQAVAVLVNDLAQGLNAVVCACGAGALYGDALGVNVERVALSVLAVGDMYSRVLCRAAALAAYAQLYGGLAELVDLALERCGNFRNSSVAAVFQRDRTQRVQRDGALMQLAMQGGRNYFHNDLFLPTGSVGSAKKCIQSRTLFSRIIYQHNYIILPPLFQ